MTHADDAALARIADARTAKARAIAKAWVETGYDTDLLEEFITAARIGQPFPAGDEAKLEQAQALRVLRQALLIASAFSTDPNRRAHPWHDASLETWRSAVEILRAAEQLTPIERT